MSALCETAARDERRAPVASLGYTPRQAERTVLHQVVREHLETFLAITIRADSSAEVAKLAITFSDRLISATCGERRKGKGGRNSDGSFEPFEPVKKR